MKWIGWIELFFVFLQPTWSYPNNVRSAFLCFLFARLLCSVPLEFCQLSLVRLTICFSLPFYKCFEFLFESIKCVVQRIRISKSLMKYKLLNSKQASYQKLRQHHYHCQKTPKISTSNTNQHPQGTGWRGWTPFQHI